MVPGALNELRRRFGLPPDPDLLTLDRYLVMDFLPPSWKFADLPYPRTTHHFCAPPFDVSTVERLPDWVEALSDQPTVYATLGTTFNQAPHLFDSIFRAFRDLPLNLVVTVGRSMDPRQFGKQPAHIHVEQYVPQTLILPHCAALIFHGGYNTLLAALWYALPMVIIPAGAGDQWPTARRSAEIGVGVMLDRNPPTPGEILAAVKSVLEQPAYRQRAAQLQQEIKGLPPLAEAVKRLEQLAETR
jgi:MGT family glycosyltransferase